jgi:hypothetical protein
MWTRAGTRPEPARRQAPPQAGPPAATQAPPVPNIYNSPSSPGRARLQFSQNPNPTAFNQKNPNPTALHCTRAHRRTTTEAELRRGRETDGRLRRARASSGGLQQGRAGPVALPGLPLHGAPPSPPHPRPPPAVQGTMRSAESMLS